MAMSGFRQFGVIFYFRCRTGIRRMILRSRDHLGEGGESLMLASAKMLFIALRDAYVKPVHANPERCWLILGHHITVLRCNINTSIEVDFAGGGSPPFRKLDD